MAARGAMPMLGGMLLPQLNMPHLSPPPDSQPKRMGEAFEVMQRIPDDLLKQPSWQSSPRNLQLPLDATYPPASNSETGEPEMEAFFQGLCSSLVTALVGQLQAEFLERLGAERDELRRKHTKEVEKLHASYQESLERLVASMADLKTPPRAQPDGNSARIVTLEEEEETMKGKATPLSRSAPSGQRHTQPNHDAKATPATGQVRRNAGQPLSPTPQTQKAQQIQPHQQQPSQAQVQPPQQQPQLQQQFSTSRSAQGSAQPWISHAHALMANVTGTRTRTPSPLQQGHGHYPVVRVPITPRMDASILSPPPGGMKVGGCSMRTVAPTVSHQQHMGLVIQGHQSAPQLPNGCNSCGSLQLPPHGTPQHQQPQPQYRQPSPPPRASPAVVASPVPEKETLKPSAAAAAAVEAAGVAAAAAAAGMPPAHERRPSRLQERGGSAKRDRETPEQAAHRERAPKPQRCRPAADEGSTAAAEQAAAA